MQHWSVCSRNSLGVALGATLALALATPNAAEACSARIGDFVWLDANRNGIQDSGEIGIPNVRVDLKDAAGTILRSVQTDAHGYYVFEEQEDGGAPQCESSYVVSVVTPDGLSAAVVGVGGNAALDSNDHNGTPVFTGTQGGTVEPVDLTIDFGFVQPVACNAAVGNRVWNDANRNGLQDVGETNLTGVAMTLSGLASASGTAVNGAYAFGNLCPGTYTVCAVTPLGFDVTLTSAGTNNAIDSDGSAVGNNSCAAVTLVQGELNGDIDFGFSQKPVTGPGTGTPGYWKNHPEAWPVATITIGGTVYTKAQALSFMGLPDGDKTITMFRSLVSAKLNVLIGNESGCIASTISAADAWMATYGPVGRGVRARTAAWVAGEPLYQELDAYNNGDRCAPHRD